MVLLPPSMEFDGHNLCEEEGRLELEKYPEIDVRDHSFPQVWEGAHLNLEFQNL
jgi:hypothetical protein